MRMTCLPLSSLYNYLLIKKEMQAGPLGANHAFQIPFWWYQTPYLANTYHPMPMILPNQAFPKPAGVSIDFSSQNFPKVNVKQEQEVTCLISSKEEGSNTREKPEKDSKQEREEKNYMLLRSQKNESADDNPLVESKQSSRPDITVLKSTEDRFVKKNIDSNVINQVFSFLWNPQKCEKYVGLVVKDQKKRLVFHRVMHCFKLIYQGQAKRPCLEKMMLARGWESCFKKLIQKCRKIKKFPLSELVRIVRRLVHVYLKQLAPGYILTSRKMNPNLWYLHLAKCRELNEDLFSKPHP